MTGGAPPPSLFAFACPAVGLFRGRAGAPPPLGRCRGAPSRLPAGPSRTHRRAAAAAAAAGGVMLAKGFSPQTPDGEDAPPPPSTAASSPIPQGPPRTPDDDGGEWKPLGPTLRQMRATADGVDMAVGDDGVRSPDAGVLPQRVADRMGRRMAVLGGVPFFVGVAVFLVYFLLAYRYDVRVIPVFVGYSTLFTFGGALVGVTYGIMSASWDEEVEGSFWGWQEAQLNVLRAKEGLTTARGREVREEAYARSEEAALKREREDRAAAAAAAADGGGGKGKLKGGKGKGKGSS